MKKLFLFFFLLTSVAWSQIETRIEHRRFSEINPITDSTVNLGSYETAEQFLGLAGKELYLSKINSKYNLVSTKTPIKYLTKKNIKTRLGHSYKKGEYVPLFYDDEFIGDYENKYFKVDSIKFFKSIKEVTPEEWTEETKYSKTIFIRNNVEIYMTNSESKNSIVYRIDKKGAKDGFTSVPYFEYLKKKYIGLEILSSSKYTIFSDKYLSKLPITYEPDPIVTDDIYTIKELVLLELDSDYSKYPELVFLLDNKKGDEKRIFIENKITNGLKNLITVEDYSNYIERWSLNSEERKEKIYLLFGNLLGNKILQGTVELGMSQLAVIYAIGYPDSINETKFENHISEQFVYTNFLGDGKDRYYYFENDKLIAIQK